MSRMPGSSPWKVQPSGGEHGGREGCQAKPDTVLTFWVYPDSFPLYRSLVDFAHKEGYTVAARPLPEGLRIAGSPAGSKSAGQ